MHLCDTAMGWEAYGVQEEGGPIGLAHPGEGVSSPQEAASAQGPETFPAWASREPGGRSRRPPLIARGAHRDGLVSRGRRFEQRSD